MKTIITISRQYGSGGREIGRKLAEQLGVPFYDNEIISRAAKETGFSEAAFETVEDKATNSLLYSIAMGMNVFTNQDAGFAGLSLDDRIFLAQSNVIRKVAEEGGCVIVGRCADYVLRDMDHVTHIFLYASLEKRVERIMRLEHVDADKARELIRKTDKQRKSYYNFFADGNWGVRSNYDLMLRTDDHTPEEIAEMIIAYAHPGK